MGGMFTPGFWTSYLKELLDEVREFSIDGLTYKNALLELYVLLVRAILFPSSFVAKFFDPFLYLFLVEVYSALLLEALIRRDSQSGPTYYWFVTHELLVHPAESLLM